jgi:hypothetical protein
MPLRLCALAPGNDPIFPCFFRIAPPLRLADANDKPQRRAHGTNQKPVTIARPLQALVSLAFNVLLWF